MEKRFAGLNIARNKSLQPIAQTAQIFRFRLKKLVFQNHPDFHNFITQITT